jgi:hypothetical protein
MRFLHTRGHNKEGEKEMSSLSRNEVGTASLEEERNDAFSLGDLCQGEIETNERIIKENERGSARLHYQL